MWWFWWHSKNGSCFFSSVFKPNSDVFFEKDLLTRPTWCPMAAGQQHGAALQERRAMTVARLPHRTAQGEPGRATLLEFTWRFSHKKQEQDLFCFKQIIIKHIHIQQQPTNQQTKKQTTNNNKHHLYHISKNTRDSGLATWSCCDLHH